MNLEVDRVRRFGAAASMVMINLDQFKAVNNTCGHTVGDEGLRCLTQAHKKCLRQIDVLARIGGEERGGPGCLNRFSASISGASAAVRLPCGLVAD